MMTDDPQAYHGDQFVMHVNGESPFCMPETNIIRVNS